MWTMSEAEVDRWSCKLKLTMRDFTHLRKSCKPPDTGVKNVSMEIEIVTLDILTQSSMWIKSFVLEPAPRSHGGEDHNLWGCCLL